MNTYVISTKLLNIVQSRQIMFNKQKNGGGGTYLMKGPPNSIHLEPCKADVLPPLHIVSTINEYMPNNFL